MTKEHESMPDDEARRGVPEASESNAIDGASAGWRTAYHQGVAERNVSPRGFACIALHRPKDAQNVGGVLRAAHCYGAAQVSISGARNNWLQHATNTPSAHKHMPVVLTDDPLAQVPFGTQIVAVDLLPGAVPMPSFTHPERALYLFGPEDGTLGGDLVRRAHHVVMVPTRGCMNLAACVNVVLYDRMAKALERSPGYPRVIPAPFRSEPRP